jgi:FlaA1/EpsC-like NDP-sugar epimerase
MTSNKRAGGVIIVGAGEAGQLLAHEIDGQKGVAFHIIGFVDDNQAMADQPPGKHPILGAVSDLAEIVQAHGAKEILIALPSQRGAVVRDILLSTAGLGLTYRILPRLSEVLLQDYDMGFLKFVRKLEVEDLLGGEILKSDQQDIAEFVEGKTLFITGAAGSIGSELSRQLAAYKAKKIIFYDWWENGMFELRNQLLESYDEKTFEFIIGDIKDRKKLNRILKLHKPHTIFHAAAYKHVPLMEGSNAAEAVKNNIVGTKIVGELAIQHGVKKFILVSTDKAVNPTNVMGATKRAAEKVTHILAGSQDKTTFCAVRFGNVINSNGSAIPFFRKQIARGGPVTVTHTGITRYFMTIPEAVHLILQSWTIGENNDLFVLDMGESVRIYDLARALIALEGSTPDQEIEIDIIGLRPGEKLYEEVLMEEEGLDATEVMKVYRTKNYMNFDSEIFIDKLEALVDLLDDDDCDEDVIKDQLQGMISTYSPRRG